MNPHLTLTLSPPIGMGAEREQEENLLDQTESSGKRVQHLAIGRKFLRTT
jgi:hypothetical protein